MFYSDSDDEEISVSPTVSRKTADLSLQNEEEEESSPFGVPDNEPRPTSRPQSSRALAAKKALQMQEKRKQMRTSSATGMVTASDSLPRPSSSTSRTSSSSGGSDKLFQQRSEVKDLLKERSGKATESEKDLMSHGLSGSFDPEAEKTSAAEEREEKFAKVGKAPTAIEKTSSASLTDNSNLDTSDLKAFIMRPAPKNSIVQCRIEREKGTDRVHNAFYVYLEDGNKFLACARKRKKSKTSNYLVSVDKKDQLRGGDSYVGKIRSNFMGTEFVFYDKGEAPEKAEKGNARQELGGVVYSSNVYGMKGPRKMRVILPAINADDGSVTTFRPMKSSESIVEKYKANDLKGIAILQNKAPVWNEQTKSYMLNFRNRVKQASVKNFQVVSVEDTDNVLMQFGRVSDDVFSLDYSWPLNLYQAIAVAMTSFDNKLACQ